MLGYMGRGGFYLSSRAMQAHPGRDQSIRGIFTRLYRPKGEQDLVQPEGAQQSSIRFLMISATSIGTWPRRTGSRSGEEQVALKMQEQGQKSGN